MTNIHIGTSGWSYDSWLDDFYPEQKNASQDQLSFYAQEFNTVELNNSFYQLPDKKTVQHWKEITPDNFIFACKASRYITHMKKLNDPRDDLNNLFTVLEGFAEKLGPILFQLPPRWHKDASRLQTFLQHLSSEHQYTFEFRDKSWFDEEIYDLLEQYSVSLCFYDYKGEQSPEIITSDLIYIRLHGPKEEPYIGSYDGRTLAGYAKKCLRWQKEGKEIFCYFDNDKNACAPNDALKLIQSIERQS